jgi:hypothetical protein
VAEKQPVQTKKGPTVDESVAKVRTGLGMAGEPIAEALLGIAQTVKSGTDEMRGYSRGAETAAKEIGRAHV